MNTQMCFDNEIWCPVDEVAPIRTAVKRPALNFHWILDEACAAKRNCRRLKRRYFQMRNDTDRRAWRAAQRPAKQAVINSRTAYLKTRLSDATSNT